MEHLNANELFSIAIMLDLPDLLTLCKSSKRINQLLCQRNDIWFYKLNIEFPNFKIYKTPKLTYELSLLKSQLNYEDSLEELYNTKKLPLNGKKLTSIPKEIGNLTNLEELSLYGNNLTSIPKEIGNLTNLLRLTLSMNQLTSIPKELGNLTNLEQIYLQDNELKEIPKKLGNLTKLKVLNLSNPIEIPKEVENIKGLTIIRS